METLMMKTGRHWCCSLSRHYADLQLLRFDHFQQLITDYPDTAATLLKISKRRAARYELLSKSNIFNVIAIPSSKSIGKYAEEELTPQNIWIPLQVLKEENSTQFKRRRTENYSR